MSDLTIIEELIQPILKRHQVELYELKWHNENKMKILRISVMQPDGSMDLETCSQISEEVSEILDEKDLISFEYYLEVCSPGAERVLKSKEDISNQVGQYVFVQYKNPTDGKDSIIGTLLSFEDDVVTIEYLDKTRKKTEKIHYDEMKLIRLAVKI